MKLANNKNGLVHPLLKKGESGAGIQEEGYFWQGVIRKLVNLKEERKLGP